MTDGGREGEYLFSSSTVLVSPRFYRGIKDLPLQTKLPIESYRDFAPQLTGPLFPSAVVTSMPELLRQLWFGTPIWKVVAIAISLAIPTFMIGGLQWVLSSRLPRARIAALVFRAILPLAILAVITVVLPIFRIRRTCRDYSPNTSKRAHGIGQHRLRLALLARRPPAL